jgi:photosystem II stability/assembly factor-like uncharacterized protein
MRKKSIKVFTLILLIMILQACNLPWQESPTLESGKKTPGMPLETDTQAPPEVSTSTATVTPSPTLTEEPGVSLPVFTGPVIFDFSMFTSTHGWALTQDNDRLLRTVDGGQTWLDATPPDLHPLPADVTALWIQPFFLDEETAWFTSNTLGSELYFTEDGGLTWRVTPIPFERARYYFLDLNLGYALVDLGAAAGSHYVAIYRTEDSGATWTEVFTHEPGVMKSLREGGSKGGMTYLDKNHGWIGGTYPMTDYFYLYFTEDGGTTWALETDISLPAVYNGSWLEVRQPIFMSDTVGYLPVRALAPDNNTYLMVYRSDDSGETWTFQNSVQDGSTLDFHALDEGWLASSTELFQTTDGGMNWNPVTISTGPVGEYILEIEFVDDQHGWLIATPDEETWDPRKLYRTTDGGVNWTQLVP